MATNPVTYTGKDAAIQIGKAGSLRTHSTLGISDYSLTLDRGTVEQELVGETGNYFTAGSLSVEGSLTACKLEDGAAGDLLMACITGSYIVCSGHCGTKSLHWYFQSCAVTGFDIALGDADTITEGSVDFVVMDPQYVTTVTKLDLGGTVIESVYT